MEERNIKLPQSLTGQLNGEVQDVK